MDDYNVFNETYMYHKLSNLSRNGLHPSYVKVGISERMYYQRLLDLNYVTALSFRLTKNRKNCHGHFTITPLGQEMLKFHKL